MCYKIIRAGEGEILNFYFSHSNINEAQMKINEIVTFVPLITLTALVLHAQAIAFVLRLLLPCCTVCPACAFAL